MVRITAAHGGGAPRPVLLAAGRDGVVLASAGPDGDVCRWHAGTGAPLWRHAVEADDQVLALAAVTVDGAVRMVAAATWDGVVRWDATTGAQLPGRELCADAFWSLDATVLPDGRAVVVGASDEGVRRLDAFTGAPVGDVLVPGLCARAVGCHRLGDGTVVLVSGHEDGAVRRFDAPSGAPLGPPLHVGEGSVTKLAALDLPGGRTLLAACHFDGFATSLHRWDLRTGESMDEPVALGKGVASFLSAVRLAGEPVLLTAGGAKTVHRLHAVTGRPLAPATPAASGACATGPDGTVLLATGSTDGSIVLERLGPARAQH